MKQAIESFNACRDDFIAAHMAAIGLAPHERTAQWDQVPEAIKKALPKGWRFGLEGGYGIGKTFAVAAILARDGTRSVDHHMKVLVELGDLHNLESATQCRKLNFRPWALWCAWPQESAAHRAQLFRGQQGEVEDWILSLQDPGRLIILDDLGKGGPTPQDWLGEVLGRIVDERHRQQAPTIWTSNLDQAGLAERYGAYTFSRLQALAPPVVLPRLPDLRLQPKVGS